MLVSNKPSFPIISYTTFKTLFDSGARVTYCATSTGYIINCSLNSYPFSSFAKLPSEIADFENNVQPTATQGETSADAEALLLVASKLVAGIVETEITRYDVQSDAVYVGTAVTGSLTSQAVWSIQRITLVDGNPTYKQNTASLSAIWDDRTTETYF